MKILNLNKITTISNIRKSFNSDGTYVDNSLNRKLGRVGQPYKKGDPKMDDEHDGGNSKKSNEKEKKKGKFSSMIAKTDTLKNLHGKQLDHVIEYSNSAADEGVEGIKVKDGASDHQKRVAIAKFYNKAAEGDPSNLDGIVEDALDEYVPKKKENDDNSDIMSKFQTRSIGNEEGWKVLQVPNANGWVFLAPKDSRHKPSANNPKKFMFCKGKKCVFDVRHKDFLSLDEVKNLLNNSSNVKSDTSSKNKYKKSITIEGEPLNDNQKQALHKVQKNLQKKIDNLIESSGLDKEDIRLKLDGAISIDNMGKRGVNFVTDEENFVYPNGRMDDDQMDAMSDLDNKLHRLFGERNIGRMLDKYGWNE